MHIALSENCLKFLVDVFNFDATHRAEVCTSWESNCRFFFTRHNSWRWHDYWCDCIFYNNVRYESKMKKQFYIVCDYMTDSNFFPLKSEFYCTFVTSLTVLKRSVQFFSNSSMVIRELQFIELFYFQFKQIFGSFLLLRFTRFEVYVCVLHFYCVIVSFFYRIFLKSDFFLLFNMNFHFIVREWDKER